MKTVVIQAIVVVKDEVTEKEITEAIAKIPAIEMVNNVVTEEELWED